MTNRIYLMNSEFSFGKYKGSTVEDVLHDNYEYIIWLLDNVEWFKVSEEVYEILTKKVDESHEHDYFDYRYLTDD